MSTYYQMIQVGGQDMLNSKVEKDKIFIKKFMDITVRKICIDLGINPSNISSGKASDKQYELLREEIDRRLDSLYE